MASMRLPYCGCLYYCPVWYRWQYLPQILLDVHAEILSSSSRTTLTQTFINPSPSEPIKEASYTFPIYDGVSVVGFRSTIGDRTLNGVVKEKEQAKADFDEAVERGEQASYLEQNVDASDVFRTRLGNVPADGKVVVEITFVGELKQDAQANGVRYTLPTAIAPRYGDSQDSSSFCDRWVTRSQNFGINITIDVAVEKESIIRSIQSPSHPYEMSLGRTTRMPKDAFEPNFASAKASIPASSGRVVLDTEFVILVNAQGQDDPVAFLETHPILPSQRAVMASLVPKFNLPSIKPEIVFIIDRSGSMHNNIATLQSALRVFLKSLPVGVMFNICSFGSSYGFLWPRSRAYDAASLAEALHHVGTVRADMGGTDMHPPVEATIKNRFSDLELEVLLLTDGDVWQQEELFELINKATSENPIRFFTLGIGVGTSSSLIEGVARAGCGFAQTVLENEQLDKKVVRMLKGALTPHITDYSIGFEYDPEEKDDFEVVEKEPLASAADPPTFTVSVRDGKPHEKQPISLFDINYKEEEIGSGGPPPPGARYQGLPHIELPKSIQAPTRIPPLYPLFRSTVFVLLAPGSEERTPKSLILRGTSKHGPLLLKIPIQDVGTGTTVHQLAAKKAILELEEHRGWLSVAKDRNGSLLKNKHESKWEDIVARECVRLGCDFQIAGKYTAFVAVEKNRKGEVVSDTDVGREASADISNNDGLARNPTYVGKMAKDSVIDAFARSALMPSRRLGQSHLAYGPYPVQAMHVEGPRFNLDFGDLDDSDILENFDFGTFLNADAEAANFRFDSQTPRSQALAHPSYRVANPSMALGGGGGRSPPSSSPAPKRRHARMVPVEQPVSSLMDYTDKDGSADRSGLASSAGALHLLIALQTFDGYWEWNAKLFQALGLDAQTIEGKIQAASSHILNIEPQHEPIPASILATTLALIFLRKKAADDKDIWELISDKAQSWMDSALKTMDTKFEKEFGAVKSIFEDLF